MTTETTDKGRGVDCTPPIGNYGGLTYSGEQGDPDAAAVSQHEAQTSDLAAPAGHPMLDYLRARLPDTGETWQALGEWLGPRTERGFGWHGHYDRSWRVLQGGLLAACSDRERARIEGVLVDLPGKACACLGDRIGPFLAWCAEHGNITRCDWALDDRSGRLTLERILDADAGGGLVTRWRAFTLIDKRRHGQSLGWTLYFGQRAGAAMARIYDKAAEQKRPEMGHWVRFELETKGELADALAREFLAEGVVAIIKQVNRRIRFVVPSETDTNTRRAEPVTWWADFIGTLEPGCGLLPGERPEATVASVAQWVEHQAGPSLAMLSQAPEGERILDSIIDGSERRMGPKHKHALSVAWDGLERPGEDG